MSLIQNAFDRMRRAKELESSAAPNAHLVAELAAQPEFPYKRIKVDQPSLRAQGYRPEEGNERRLADYYRQIKRPLIEAALETPDSPELRLVLVTSALPGDGKSFTSINLAMSLARERDYTTLLVDADLPKAHISNAFGLQGERGLVDALLDESIDIESLVLRTDIAGLDILPAGKWDDGVTELITSARMAQLVARMATFNPRRFAVLDSSPLLVSMEARALARIPGQIVLVVRADKTPRQAVLDAISHVDKKKLKGLVLNDAKAAVGSSYYGYYSYYGTAKDGTPRGG